MTDQQSIVAIFDLLNNSAVITPSARKTIDNISKTYPYFLPARYIKAQDQYRRTKNFEELTPVIAGYVGNWLLFNQFLTTPATQGAGQTTEPEADQTNPNQSDPPLMPDGPIDNPFIKKGDKPIVDSIPAPARKSFTDTKKEPPRLQSPIIESVPSYVANIDEIEDAEIEEADFEELVQSKPQEDKMNSVQASPLGNFADGGTTISPEPVSDNADMNNLQAEADKMISDFFKSRVAVETNPPAEPLTHADKPDQSETVVLPNNFMEAESTLPEKEESHEETEPAFNDAELIQPVFTEDYFKHQGVEVPGNIHGDFSTITESTEPDDAEKSLMIMMSFNEWLLHFKKKQETVHKEIIEQKTQKAVWQKEKLAAALEEEDDEIPEEVFDMAMNSIAREDGLASESLADIYIKQGKYEKAVEMFNKLSLRNPEKNSYFARKIEDIKREFLS